LEVSVGFHKAERGGAVKNGKDALTLGRGIAVGGGGVGVVLSQEKFQSGVKASVLFRSKEGGGEKNQRKDGADTGGGVRRLEDEAENRGGLKGSRRCGIK